LNAKSRNSNPDPKTQTCCGAHPVTRALRGDTSGAGRIAKRTRWRRGHAAARCQRRRLHS